MATEARISFLLHPIFANKNAYFRPFKAHFASLFRRTTILFPSFRQGKLSRNCPNRCPVIRGYPLHCKTGRMEEELHISIEDLRVPDLWLVPSCALEESEWLKVTLHKWLDDEYCPEPTNVQISNIAAKSFYESLVGRQTDLGEILLKMAGDLESISYQESFHGAFSSANAAISLIAERIELDSQ